MWNVEIERSAEKELKRAPAEICDAFDAWKNVIEQYGPGGVQQINGYWDHALRGDWQGARSSSLSRRWRVIYVVDRQFIRVLILKVTPHKY